MWLKLPPGYEDPATKMPLPNAILVIEDAEFRMRSLSTILQTAVYASAEALMAGGRPVSRSPIALSPAEIQAQQPAILQACYSVLAARSQFAGTQVVSSP